MSRQRSRVLARLGEQVVLRRSRAATPEETAPRLLRASRHLELAHERELPRAQHLVVLGGQFAQHHGLARLVRVPGEHLVDLALLQLHEAREQQGVVHPELARAVGETRAVDHGGLPGVDEPQVAQRVLRAALLRALGGHEEHGVVPHGPQQIPDVLGAQTHVGQVPVRGVHAAHPDPRVPQPSTAALQRGAGQPPGQLALGLTETDHQVTRSGLPAARLVPAAVPGLRELGGQRHGGVRVGAHPQHRGVVGVPGVVLQRGQHGHEVPRVLHVQGLGVHHRVAVLRVDQKLPVAHGLVRAVHGHPFHAHALAREGLGLPDAPQQVRVPSGDPDAGVPALPVAARGHAQRHACFLSSGPMHRAPA